MNNRISFIICTNSDLYYDECVSYINRLIIPENYYVDVIEIREAQSITAGYNEGMRATDAWIKIYLHQDTFILYPYFVQALIDIFTSDSNIGMVGMVGAESFSKDAVMWHSKEVGNVYPKLKCREYEGSDYNRYNYSINDGFWEVDVVDGFLIATAYDIPWREDIFDGWDFYDVSMSLEMKKNGKRVVVPVQKLPWCYHDDGEVLNLRNYNAYRLVCLENYNCNMK